MHLLCVAWASVAFAYVGFCALVCSCVCWCCVLYVERGSRCVLVSTPSYPSPTLVPYPPGPQDDWETYSAMTADVGAGTQV